MEAGEEFVRLIKARVDDSHVNRQRCVNRLSVGGREGGIQVNCLAGQRRLIDGRDDILSVC